jgi:hypothetical protein
MLTAAGEDDQRCHARAVQERRRRAQDEGRRVRGYRGCSRSRRYARCCGLFLSSRLTAACLASQELRFPPLTSFRDSTSMFKRRRTSFFRSRLVSGSPNRETPLGTDPSSASSTNSIGKGFQGVMKRHNFAGLRASHGVSVSHRSHGSTGQHQVRTSFPLSFLMRLCFSLDAPLTSSPAVSRILDVSSRVRRWRVAWEVST